MASLSPGDSISIDEGVIEIRLASNSKGFLNFNVDTDKVQNYMLGCYAYSKSYLLSLNGEWAAIFKRKHEFDLQASDKLKEEFTEEIR